MAWLDHVHERAVKRLQLAAETSGALVLLFRFARSIPASPAALRLHVSRSESRTVVRILKRRGGGMPPPVVLDLHGALVRRKSIADERRSILNRQGAKDAKKCDQGQTPNSITEIRRDSQNEWISVVERP
jgi:hypothetical protein